MTLFSRNVLLRLFLCVITLCANAAMTQPAHAEGSFLLQLGTFETRDEAMKKWQEVQGAQGDIVGKLRGNVAEVMLPSDSAPSYRTQVGPVASRKEAKSLCKALSSRNVPCFVVETAFAASDLTPEMAGDLTSAPVSDPEENIRPRETRAIAPEDQIISGSVEPIEIAAAPSPAPQETMQAEPAKEIVVATPVRQPKKTVVKVTRRGDDKFNPNDMKKSSFFRGTLNLDESNSEQTEEVVAAAPAPVAEDDKPGFFGRLFGSDEKPVRKPVASSPAAVTAATPTPVNLRGDVVVAEAIRVPVTSGTRKGNATRYVPVSETGNQDGGPISLAGATGEGAYWVQVSYFKNETDAHAFYSEMQMNAPETFTNIRLRITRPFAARSSRVSLRMGAFVSKADFQSICSEARARGMRCTSIRDTSVENYVPPAAKSRKKYMSPLEAVQIPAYNGASAATGATPAPTLDSSYQPESVASAVAEPVVGGQWLNLGGYSSTQEAWDHWKSVQASVPALRDVKSSIMSTLGAGSGKKYQLRAGPIATDVDAENICKAIVRSKNYCVVTDGQ